MDKLSIGSVELEESPKTQPKDTTYVVLVSTGSFNPPTYMHLRIFELARDALNSEGFCVIGGWVRSSEFIMVDPWEASQDTFQRTLTVLCRIKSSLCDSGRISGESLKVMLVCGSDLLESFSIPGAWIPEQVRTLCRDFGVVCIHREGQDIEKVISNDDILNEYKTNIKVVDELVPNQISSTRVRDCILRGLSVKYLTADEVINYIKQHRLYLDSTV
ncbi:hypothetical protein TEA_000793 [Camellia sinensis var. sinensis]|uniref:Cytidyltransferase-like domain-containing protein n=1 Tax=Camellia sinensis var. sinensis TaxID=542762 RepID=A0A4S4DR80_CAMSN|nr:hypothetical protein TEA_000793 [Camellia sinensis var. sinensis]